VKTTFFGNVDFINAQDSTLIQSFKDAAVGFVLGAGFTPDSRLFCIITFDGKLILWGVP
jgi:hypothetical protein